MSGEDRLDDVDVCDSLQGRQLSGKVRGYCRPPSRQRPALFPWCTQEIKRNRRVARHCMLGRRPQ